MSHPTRNQRNSNMKVGLIVAMDSEYKSVLDLLGGKPDGRIGNTDVALRRGGIGKVNAAVCTMRLIQECNPDAILSTGLAGGIDIQMRLMDIVAANQTVYHDVDCGGISSGGVCPIGQVQGLPARFDADPRLLDHALSVPLAEGERLVKGLICTGDQFITDRERQGGIKNNFPDGMACDMESAAIAQTCYLMNVPFLSLRVISDTPGHIDDHQQQWTDFLGSMCDFSFRFVKKFLETLPDNF